MEFWSVIFFITSLAFFIVPIVLCYKMFSKGPKGSYVNGCYIFTMINFSPAYGGSIGPLIDSYSTLMLLIWIIGSIVAIAIILLNYFLMKKKAKISHDDYAFNHSSGLIGCYSMFYFAMYGFLILFIEDDEDFSFFELAYRKHAWIYYFIELIYFSGLFLSSCTEFFIIKYDLNKIILIFIIIAQTVAYVMNIAIIIEFKAMYLITILIISLIEIGYGVFIWKNYYSDVDPPLPENENKTFLIGNTQV